MVLDMWGIPGKSRNDPCGKHVVAAVVPQQPPVRGLLLTRFTFVLASIFGKSAIVFGWCVGPGAVWGRVVGRWGGGGVAGRWGGAGR